MSNTNTNLQTQTSNALHNAIMETGGKDRPPMSAPGNYFRTTSEGYMGDTYKNVSQDIRDQLNAEAEVVQIILTWIDNDIYSIVDACPNSCEMWKAIKRLKQGESINVQDLKTNLYWEFGKFTSRDGESLILLKKIYNYQTNNLRTSSNIVGVIRLLLQGLSEALDMNNQRVINLLGLGRRRMSETETGKGCRLSQGEMLLCKQEEAKFQLNAEQADWRDGIY
ncbi:hypothetical protein Tco_0411173 [Tanacetum coccineum]